MRISGFRLSLLLILTAGVVPRFAAAAPTGELPPPIYLVVTTKGDTIQALAVEPQPFDMVRVTTPAGEYSDVSAVRIRRVLDESGRDCTKEVLERRRAVGQPIDDGVRAHRRPSAPSLYGPKSVTRGVGITEMSAWGRVGAPASAERSYNFLFDVGHLFNVGRKTGLGATLFLGGGEGSAEAGIRARFRYWIGREASIDVSPGVILAHDEPGRSTGDGPGWVGQIALNPTRFLSVGAQVYTVKRTSVTYYDGGWFVTPRPSYTVQGGRETGFMIGMKVGGKPALLAAAAAAIVVISRHGGGRAVYDPSPLGPR